MRDELAEKARDAADRAREAAGGASDWVPLFQRPETNGGTSQAEGPQAQVESEPSSSPSVDATKAEGEELS
jgi:hypothetical protein